MELGDEINETAVRKAKCAASLAREDLAFSPLQGILLNVRTITSFTVYLLIYDAFNQLTKREILDNDGYHIGMHITCR